MSSSALDLVGKGLDGLPGMLDLLRELATVEPEVALGRQAIRSRTMRVSAINRCTRRLTTIQRAWLKSSGNDVARAKYDLQLRGALRALREAGVELTPGEQAIVEDDSALTREHDVDMAAP